MKLDIPFTETGSVILTGFEQQMQSIVGRQIVAQHLESGGMAVALVDHESDGREQTAAMADTLRCRESHPWAIDRFKVVMADRNAAIHASIDVAQFKNRKKPLLVIRDLGSAMRGLPPGDPWLSVADDLALAIDAPVWTVCHHGRVGFPAPRYSDYAADAVWQCVAGLNLTVQLTRHVPSSATIKLLGKVLHGGTITFEQEMEKAHVQ